jgi:hypothetical protein
VTLDDALVDRVIGTLASDRRVAFLLAFSAELALLGRSAYVEAGLSVADSYRALRCE